MGESESKSSAKSDILVWIVIIALIGFFAWASIPKAPRPRSSSANACINILRQIDAAKNEWARESAKTNGTFVTENDIKPFIKLNSKGNIPSCPSGGKYTIGKVGELPTCSIGTNGIQPHVLP